MSTTERRPFQAMTRGPFAALLRVPDDGFSWRDDLVLFDSEGAKENTEGPWLIRSDSLYERQYPPLAVPNLHRRFSRIEPMKESVLSFANKYGFLGHAPWLEGTSSDQQSMQFGESLGFWQNEIYRMAELVALWDLVESGSRVELGQMVEWMPPGESQHIRLYLVSIDGRIRPDLAHYMRQGPDKFREHLRLVQDSAGRLTNSNVTVLAHEELRNGVELLERWEHGDPVEPIRYFVHREVNNRLRGHVSPSVLPFRKGEIYFFPDCLLSSLYTKFMLELSGRSRPAMLCERPHCGLYFEPLHGRQKYCDKRCQQLAYYYRRKEKQGT